MDLPEHLWVYVLEKGACNERDVSALQIAVGRSCPSILSACTTVIKKLRTAALDGLGSSVYDWIKRIAKPARLPVAEASLPFPEWLLRGYTRLSLTEAFDVCKEFLKIVASGSYIAVRLDEQVIPWDDFCGCGYEITPKGRRKFYLHASYDGIRLSNVQCGSQCVIFNVHGKVSGPIETTFQMLESNDHGPLFKALWIVDRMRPSRLLPLLWNESYNRLFCFFMFTMVSKYDDRALITSPLDCSCDFEGRKKCIKSLGDRPWSSLIKFKSPEQTVYEFERGLTDSIVCAVRWNSVRITAVMYCPARLYAVDYRFDVLGNCDPNSDMKTVLDLIATTWPEESPWLFADTYQEWLNMVRAIQHGTGNAIGYIV